MVAQQLEIECYANISEFEITLRRVVRWELMTKYGRSWLTELDGYLDLINDRIAAEARKGMARGSSSYLSYLTLGELQTLIFKDFWQNFFSIIFQGKKSLQRDLLNLLLPVRNKIAHFRPITHSESLGLNIATDFFDLLRSHYQTPDNTLFYLSGDPQNAGELIDKNIINEAQECLRTCGFPLVLDLFFELQWLRAYGISPGIGIFKGNLFIEVYFDKSYSSNLLKNWIDKKEYEITMATFNSTSRVVRIFIPTVLGEKTILKTINAFASIAKDSCLGDYLNNHRSNSIEVASEIFIDKECSNSLSFAF